MKVRFRDTQGRGQNPDILGTRRPWDVFSSYGDPMFWGTNLGPTGAIAGFIIDQHCFSCRGEGHRILDTLFLIGSIAGWWVSNIFYVP